MRAALFAYSRQGCKTARRVMEALSGAEIRAYTMERFEEPGFSPLERPSRPFYGPLFDWADAMVFVGSAGIAVREIAPFVKDKGTDPAVIAIDELGTFTIPLLSGHIGGANPLALKLAEALGATPVITTATDINLRFSVDAWAAHHRLAITDMRAAKSVSAAILEGSVPLTSRFPIVTGLPSGVVSGGSGEVGICISHLREKPFDLTLLLVPPVLRLGLGCRRGTPVDSFREAVDLVLREHDIHPKAIGQAASIDLKAGEDGLLAFCRERELPIEFYTAQQLRELPGEFTPSQCVMRIAGVDNVCERSAMMGAKQLLVRKTIHKGVTVAIAMTDWEVRFE